MNIRRHRGKGKVEYSLVNRRGIVNKTSSMKSKSINFETSNKSSKTDN